MLDVVFLTLGRPEGGNVITVCGDGRMMVERGTFPRSGTIEVAGMLLSWDTPRIEGPQND